MVENDRFEEREIVANDETGVFVECVGNVDAEDVQAKKHETDCWAENNEAEDIEGSIVWEELANDRKGFNKETEDKE